MSLKKAFLRGQAAQLAARQDALTPEQKKTRRFHGIYNRQAEKLATRLDRELSEIIAKNYGFTWSQVMPRFSRPRLGSFDANITYLLFKMDTAALPEKFNLGIGQADFIKCLQDICDAPHINADVSPTWIHNGGIGNSYYEFGVDIRPRSPVKIRPAV